MQSLITEGIPLTGITEVVSVLVSPLPEEPNYVPRQDHRTRDVYVEMTVFYIWGIKQGERRA